MRRTLVAVTDRLLGLVVPELTASAGCWTVCCDSRCRRIKTCCHSGMSTYCYQCRD